MNARELISALEALALPDSPVFFAGDDGRPVLIMGGIARDQPRAPGGKVISLSPIALDQVGGF